MVGPVGLLALQGDFEMHRQAFAALDAQTRLVRRPAELSACAALVIPGGESTALARLLDHAGLREPLIRFASSAPILGTCAGLILLARELADEPVERHGVRPLGLIDCTVQRNGYGRQIDSFTDDVTLGPPAAGDRPFRAVFIRAPRILCYGKEVTVVASRGDEPVAVRQGNIFGLAFHPELTADLRCHEAFLAVLAGH